jgi:hypothetical protein
MRLASPKELPLVSLGFEERNPLMKDILSKFRPLFFVYLSQCAAQKA